MAILAYIGSRTWLSEANTGPSWLLGANMANMAILGVLEGVPNPCFSGKMAILDQNMAIFGPFLDPFLDAFLARFGHFQELFGRTFGDP